MSRVDSVEQSRLFEENAAIPRRLRPLGEPPARVSDPVTSHEAAAVARRGNAELIRCIRWYVSKQREPVSAFQIADAVAGNRWQHDTVRTAVSRAGLHAVDTLGVTRGGRRCLRFVLKDGAA